MAAADTARLVASLTLDAKGFNSGVAKAQTGLSSLEKTAGRVGDRAAKGLGKAADNLAKIGTLGIVVGAGLLAKTVSQASDLNEQLSKTRTIFKDAGEGVVAFSKTTAAALGVSQTEALEAAGNFGNMFKTVGLADKQSAEFSTTLVTLAADMASFNNEDPSEMLDKLRSGLAGEAEPLRQFGVLLSEAEVKAEAYRTGIAKTGDALTEAQKVQARYSLILKQTAVQQGDFKRTSGGLANQIRILKASFADTGAVIGTALLPKITELAVKLNKAIKDNQPAIKDFAEKLPGAFDKVASFAERIPWEAIGNGLEKAAFFADKLFDAFLALPPEVQGTLIALAGLNKLTGGAVTGIASELGKGLIKGVLSMNAGVVNINAASVNGIPGGGGPVGTVEKVVGGGLTAAAVGTAAIGAAILAGFDTVAAHLGGDVVTAITGSVQKGDLFKDVTISTSSFGGPLDRAIRALSGDFRSQLEIRTEKLNDTFKVVGGQQAMLLNVQNERTEAISGQVAAAHASAVADSASERAAIATAKASADAYAARQIQQLAGDSSSERASIAAAAASQRAAQAETTHAAQQAAAAIRDKDLSVKVQNFNTVSTTVSVRETIKGQTTFKSYNRYQS